MQTKRTCGILLHPTSLDSGFGIGDLGPAATAFLDFLASCGQSWWQILPVGPTGAGNSPYQSHSSFAGNPLLISPERMAEQGLISWDRIDPARRSPSTSVDFAGVTEAKERLFREAFQRFDPTQRDFQLYLHGHSSWLDDFALYMALKIEHGGTAWNDWEPELATRQPDALRSAIHRLESETLYQKFVQFVFARQWDQLRDQGRQRNIRFIGDLPIYVAGDSADVWSRPDLFKLDDSGRPTVVAGVPPDLFNPTDGQRWGNPIYRWDVHRTEGYAWWISRLRSSLEKVDLLRLDHFRGFEAYWEIPASSPTAAVGEWVPGPDHELLEAASQALGGLPLIAEDLGIITPEVEKLRDDFNLPGMKVLQFAFSGGPSSVFLPHQYINNCVVYTGTHDNDSTVGWWQSPPGTMGMSEEALLHERNFVRRYVGHTHEPIHWSLNRLALGSVANTAIIPMQDILGLDHSARMNSPGEPEGQWGWRLLPGQIDHASVELLSDLTFVTNRWNGQAPDSRWNAPPPACSTSGVKVDRP